MPIVRAQRHIRSVSLRTVPTEIRGRVEALGPEHALAPGTLERVEQFFSLREAWGRVHNLSGPEALAQPWSVDFLDVLALHRLFEPRLPLVDVGSGSGVPGLIFKILRPEVEITLVEPSAKRVAFLRHAARTLALTGLTVERGRWPRVESQRIQVVSRATFPVADWPRAAAVSPFVETLYRYLALERPEFDAKEFERADVLDYDGPSGARRRLERWQRRTAPGKYDAEKGSS